jgi:hypothetical protein
MKNFIHTQWPILSVYLGMLISLAVVVFLDFRAGAILLAISVLWAFVLRLKLSDSSSD